MRAAFAATLGVLLGCSAPNDPSIRVATKTAPREPTATGAPVETSVAETGSAKAPAQNPPPEQARISSETATKVLFLNEASQADAKECFSKKPTSEANSDKDDPDRAVLDCLLLKRYAGDLDAAASARDLLHHTGSVAGLEHEQMFDGGWRGSIRLVPELPVGSYRRHLRDVDAAMTELDAFVQAVSARASSPVRYRVRAVAFRFFRSVGRTTPSAFAEHWSIGYNVAGSLLGTAKGVRETLVHEVFHLNDERPAGNWSTDALGPVVDRIVARCGTRAACLAPYAPSDTMVKGGTYYAFQPGGGAHEYAAELAVRYFIETSARLADKSPPHSFACGPPENREAWQALATEFFGGFDLTPPCG